MNCWLCRFNQTDDAKTYMAFVLDNIGQMSMDQMAADIAAKLTDTEMTAQGVLEHFHHHTLHPTLRITEMLRSLLRMSSQMDRDIRDENGRLDPKGVEMYLKLQNQIIAIYRIGESKRLMFG